jgi:hypothetical protein
MRSVTEASTTITTRLVAENAGYALRRVEDRALRLSTPTLRTGVRLSREDLRREFRHRTNDEGVAVALGMETPAVAVIRMNELGVSTGRAKHCEGTVVA